MNEILMPELVWIEGRCYRVNDANVELSALEENCLYENETTYNYSDHENDDEEIKVDMIDESRYVTSFHISMHYFGHIIGRKGAIKSMIERDTKTEIKIPRSGHTGDIIIYGPTPSNVKAARRRINLIVVAARMKQPPTHFISFPMNHEVITKNFEKFKECVLRECSDCIGIEESIFQNPTKLHLTVGVLCLMDHEERLMASKLLMEAKEKVILPLLKEERPFRIRVKGLSYMNDDPKQINVLYATVADEGSSKCLQRLSDSLFEYFYNRGFMSNEFERESIKMHLTLMNTKFRASKSSSSNEGNNSRKQSVQSFDGSRVLEKFSEYDFGVIELKEIHLSQMHTQGEDGYYKPTCVVTAQ